MARHRGYVRLIGLAAGTLLLWPLAGSAEVATDGTLGAKVRLTGRDVKVPARLGQIRGQNLFHSFERFGVPSKGRVTFTGPNGLKNVIGRVTGGERSEIHGTLASKVSGADLWLLNPAGIRFGPNAKLDVPGAFHASTADELRFADDKVFSALDPQGSVLSVAAPEAFGFLGAKPAGITVDRSVLEVTRGKAFSLAGGNLVVTGGTLGAKAGTITLLAAGVAGTVPIDVSAAVPGGAAIRLIDKARLATSGDGGGRILIRGGKLVLAGGSQVNADNTGSRPAQGGIALATEAVEVAGAGRISSDTFGSGSAGNVTVQADRLLIAGGGTTSDTGISSTVRQDATGQGGDVMVKVMGDVEVENGGELAAGTWGLGNAGAVTVNAGGVTLGTDGRISSDTFGPGQAGGVTVTADRLLIDGVGSKLATGIFSRAMPGSTNGSQAGTVTVEAAEIALRASGRISSDTFGPGNAGEVAVIVAGPLLVDGAGSEDATGITSRANRGSTGNARTVTVEAGEITLRNGGRMSSDTFGPGNAGEVAVTAGYLLVDGAGSEDATGIFSRAVAGSTGAAGTVAIKADELELRDAGVISSTTFGSGNAGEVTVTAGRLLVIADDTGRFTGITSRASAVTRDGQRIVATGDAGQVMVKADELELRDGGKISSSTAGPGTAGKVSVTADRMTMADRGTVETNSGGSGTAGDVVVQAVHLTVQDGALVGSSGTDNGAAGNVGIKVNTLAVDEASIRTEGRSNKGGAIAVIASDLIHLQDAEVTSNGIEPEAGASIITLTAPLIALNNSQVTSLTGSGVPLAGSGLAQLFGDVTVISLESFVAASSNVTVTGAEGDVGSRLVVPQGMFLDAGDLLRESCAARRSGTASSFTAMGRGGLPPDPAGPLAGSYVDLDGAAAERAGPVLAASFGEGCKAALGG